MCAHTYIHHTHTHTQTNTHTIRPTIERQEKLHRICKKNLNSRIQQGNCQQFAIGRVRNRQNIILHCNRRRNGHAQSHGPCCCIIVISTHVMLPVQLGVYAYGAVATRHVASLGGSVCIWGCGNNYYVPYIKSLFLQKRTAQIGLFCKKETQWLRETTCQHRVSQRWCQIVDYWCHIFEFGRKIFGF